MNALEPPYLLLLGSNAPPSMSAAGLCAVLATLDTVHDLVEEGDTASVGLDGSLWILVGGVEEDGLTSELQGACESTSGGGTTGMGHVGETNGLRTERTVC